MAIAFYTQSAGFSQYKTDYFDTTYIPTVVSDRLNGTLKEAYGQIEDDKEITLENAHIAIEMLQRAESIISGLGNREDYLRHRGDTDRHRKETIDEWFKTIADIGNTAGQIADDIHIEHGQDVINEVLNRNLDKYALAYYEGDLEEDTEFEFSLTDMQRVTEALAKNYTFYFLHPDLSENMPALEKDLVFAFTIKRVFKNLATNKKAETESDQKIMDLFKPTFNKLEKVYGENG